MQEHVGNGPSIFAPSYSGLHSGNLANSDQFDFSTLDLLYLMKLCQYENSSYSKIIKLNIAASAQRIRNIGSSSSQTGPMNLVQFHNDFTHPQLAPTIAQNNLFDLQRQIDRQRGLNIDKDVFLPRKNQANVAAIGANQGGVR